MACQKRNVDPLIHLECAFKLFGKDMFFNDTVFQFFLRNTKYHCKTIYELSWLSKWKQNISKLSFRFGKNLIFPYIPKSRKEFLDHVNLCVVNFKIHQNFGKFMLHNLKSDDNLCQFLNSKLFSHPRKFYKKRVKFLWTFNFSFYW